MTLWPAAAQAGWQAGAEGGGEGGRGGGQQVRGEWGWSREQCRSWLGSGLLSCGCEKQESTSQRGLGLFSC